MMQVDGYDDAIIGIAHCFGRQPVLTYSVEKICATLVKRDGMSEEEAYEFYEFNIIGSYNGEGMPVFLHKVDSQY